MAKKTTAVTRLQKNGDDVVLVLDRAVLEASGIDADTPVVVSIQDHSILIEPARSAERRQKLEDGVEKMHEKYAGVFQRLAE